MKRKHLIVGVTALALAAGGVGIAQAVGGDDSDENYTGPGADRAKAAALASTNGGTANEVEKGDEEGAWEVEVTKTDGKTVDVHLDENFKPIGTEGDSEQEDEGGSEE